MGVWTITCMIMAVIFGIIGVIFALLKEKGAMLISDLIPFLRRIETLTIRKK